MRVIQGILWSLECYGLPEAHIGAALTVEARPCDMTASEEVPCVSFGSSFCLRLFRSGR